MAESIKVPLISIIVPSYNYGHLIGETLSNLKEQTYQNWECIVVDDGSVDNTRNIVEEWCRNHHQFRYIFQKNAGLSAARNTGILASKGEFIQLLDSDDMLEPGKFSGQIAVFQQNPSAEIVYSEVRYFTTENPASRYLTLDCRYEPWMSGSSSSDPTKLITDILNGNIFPVNSPLIKRSVIDKIGLFDTHLKSVEDWDYWCRCALEGVCFVYDPSPTSHALVRTHEGSMSRNLITMKEASLMVRNKLIKKINQYPREKDRSIFHQINQTQRAFLFKSLSELYLLKGQNRKFISRLFCFSVLKKEYRFFIKSVLRFFLGKNDLPTTGI